MSVYVDDSAVLKTLSNLEKQISSRGHKNAVQRAARPAANLVKNEIRGEISSAAKRAVKHNPKGPYEHIPKVKSSVKVLRAKTYLKYIGVNVTIKGPEVPVGQGRTRRFWHIKGYAYLVFFGNYRKDRLTRGGKVDKGDVEGIFSKNPFVKAVDQHGQQAITMFVNDLKRELDREIEKAVR